MDYMSLFRAKTKEEVKEEIAQSNFFFVDGDLYTDYPFNMSLLDPEGITLHVTGDVFLSFNESEVPEDGTWIPQSQFPSKLKDVVAYSKIAQWWVNGAIETLDI